MDDNKKDISNQHEEGLNKENLFFDGEKYYTEDEFFNPDEDHEPNPNKYARWLKITITVLVTLSLFSYVLAIWPKLFNFATIEFITISRELSKNEDIQLYKESVVVVTTENSRGTGFYFSTNGYILTNEHVIDNGNRINVSFNDGKIYPAEVVSSDEAIDLAILKIDSEGLNYPILEFEQGWMQNQEVYFIGNPLYSNFIANKGTILGLTTNNGIPMLIIDAPVYKGNSGSPVINSDGKVIGVINATTNISYNGEQKKVGLAIPIEYVKVLEYE